MILGRKLRSFSAEDSGIVAPGLRASQPAKEAETAVAVELTSTVPAPAVAIAAPAEDSFAEERGRLWSLVGLLRRANARLRKNNRRLTKEVAALRSDLTGDELSVDSIVKAKAAPVGQTVSS